MQPARYKGAYGGRGSGKSHFFAGMVVDDHLRIPGLRTVCVREVLKSLKESAKLLIEDKIKALSVGPYFEIQNDKIKAPGGGVIIFAGMQDYNAESLKSLEGFDRCWVEEAQTLSERSLAMLRPTIRKPDSELWFSWNPRRKSDAVDNFLRALRPSGSIVVKANWRDNPWFPQVLEGERQNDLKLYPERYDHIWEGEYAKAFEGAYYAAGLAQAKREGRVGKVTADELLPLRAFVDIGGSGARADAFVIWIVQWVGQEIRVLDYYEAVGQKLSEHIAWLRSKKYDKAIIHLPHDGVNSNNVTGKRYAEHFSDAGFDVPPPTPNQGSGAAAMRIEAVRRLMPKCWFNEDTTEAGREALGYYHERRDEARKVGLGPEHDWSSHCFVGETEVLTRYGICQIMSLPNQGDILTPCGWKAYRNPRITRRNAPLVEVVFTSGYSVKCTPDHLFLTDSGWKSAQCLTPNTVIQSTLTKSRSISMEVSIAFGRAMFTCRAVVEKFTEMFGLVLSGQSLKVAISTIGTGTSLTTDSKTWSAWTPRSTYHSVGAAAQKLNSPAASTSVKTQEIEQQIGINPRKGVYGTSAMPSVPNRGQSGSAKKRLVSIAASCISHLSVKVGTLASIARKFAKLPLIESAANKMNTHVRIAHVRQLKETRDVWCLTVPDAECFSLANGAVVHNCADAFGLMAVCYEEPSRMKAFHRKIEYPQLGLV